MDIIFKKIDSDKEFKNVEIDISKPLIEVLKIYKNEFELYNFNIKTLKFELPSGKNWVIPIRFDSYLEKEVNAVLFSYPNIKMTLTFDSFDNFKHRNTKKK